MLKKVAGVVENVDLKWIYYACNNIKVKFKTCARIIIIRNSPVKITFSYLNCWKIITFHTLVKTPPCLISGVEMENSNGHTKVKNSLTRRFSRTCSGFHQIDTLLVCRRLFLFLTLFYTHPFLINYSCPLTSRRHGAMFALKVHLSASWLRMRAENPESNRGIFPFHVESRPSWGMRRANGISLARKTLFKRCIDARFFFSNRDMECICYALWIVYVECLLCVECRMQRWKASNVIEMLVFFLFEYRSSSLRCLFKYLISKKILVFSRKV